MATLARRLDELEIAAPQESARVRSIRTRRSDIVELDLLVADELVPPQSPGAYVRAVLDLQSSRRGLRRTRPGAAAGHLGRGRPPLPAPAAGRRRLVIRLVSGAPPVSPHGRPRIRGPVRLDHGQAQMGRAPESETAPTEVGAVGPGLLTLGGLRSLYQHPVTWRQVPSPAHVNRTGDRLHRRVQPLLRPS